MPFKDPARKERYNKEYFRQTKEGAHKETRWEVCNLWGGEI